MSSIIVSHGTRNSGRGLLVSISRYSIDSKFHSGVGSATCQELMQPNSMLESRVRSVPDVTIPSDGPRVEYHFTSHQGKNQTFVDMP
jgi:hypothetical protein